MRVGVVEQLWRYPVKSMLGERLAAAQVVGRGVVGDRAWAVRDELRGGIRGAKKIGGLMSFGARFVAEPERWGDAPPVEITLPDGGTVRSDAPDVDAILSKALEHEVTLWPLRPAADAEHYRRGAADSDDLLEELRAIFGRTEEEPLPDLSVFPPEIVEFESPPGTYYDAFPLLVLTTASLATLQALAPSSAVDVRRFRPNLLVSLDGDPAGFPENDWVGRRLRAGEAELEVVTPCPRCVMITRAVAELPQDRSLMRTVVREAAQNLGVYARVARPGRVAAGDPVVLVA